MSEFVSLLETKSDETHYGHRRRHMKALEVGPYTLSVQASEFHYCTPRVTVPVEEYTEWECALWTEERWLSVEKDPEVFDGLAVAKQWEDGESPVGGYLPTADVQALWDRLNELSDV